MSAMTAPARRDGNHQGHAGALHFRPQASSPTLTNPDMILPDYAHAESVVDDFGSPLAKWNTGPRSSIADFNFFPATTLDSSPILAVTPIIYGNGTTLSDIGEVTEVESSPGAPLGSLSSRLSARGSDGDGTSLGSSPTTGRRAIKKRITYTRANRERRMSLESISTVYEAERAVRLVVSKEMDDTVSIDDSNFQGDDEESMASSYADDAVAQHERGQDGGPLGLVVNQNRYSTVSLSKRAEQILANAKRRLNTMEGNLNRARTFSYSSMSSSSSPSPGAIPATIFSTAALVQTGLPTSYSGSLVECGSAHEAAAKNPAAKNPAASHPAASHPTASHPTRPTTQLQRSASALGAAGGYRPPLSPPDNAEVPVDKRPSQFGQKLATLNEDSDSTSTLPACNEPEKSPIANTSPTISQCSDTASVRSVSVSAAQVRNLQEQVQGLKGKVFTLKERARADSMRRRSLRSLRTPSPFTHARWDQATHGKASTDPTSPLVSSPLSGPGLKSQPSSPSSPWEGSQASAVRREEEQLAAANCKTPERCEDGHEEEEQEEPLTARLAGTRQADMHGADSCSDADSDADDADDSDEHDEPKHQQDITEHQNNIDSVSESGDSLYHDTFQHPMSHEDREDAFDYERFFLHSAMGTINRPAMVGDYGSDSDESVETTRGPGLSHARRPSLDTFTSIDSFATAHEGRMSRSSTREEQQSVNGSGVHHSHENARMEEREGKGTETEHKTEVNEDHKRHQDEQGKVQACHGENSNDSSKARQEPSCQIMVLHRPLESTSTLSSARRPSVSSFESSGTMRSFPLVNRTRMSSGILTPIGSPEHDLKHIAESLLTETASICDKESLLGGGPQSPALQMLSREDQALVEHVVAGLGRCVLGLTEATRGSGPGGQAEFRRRMVAAKRILDNSQ